MPWHSLKTLVRTLRLLTNDGLFRHLQTRTSHLCSVREIEDRYPGSKISDDIILNSYHHDRIELGGRVSICAGTVLSFGDEHNGFGKISIGDETWIGQYNNLRAGGGEIQIGRGCLISQFCTLVASNHGTSLDLPIAKQIPNRDRVNVILEDDVWLGAGVTVLPGVVIRKGAVIGAGSVVTRDVPCGEIHAGVPARKVSVRQGAS